MIDPELSIWGRVAKVETAGWKVGGAVYVDGSLEFVGELELRILSIDEVGERLFGMPSVHRTLYLASCIIQICRSVSMNRAGNRCLRSKNKMLL